MTAVRSDILVNPQASDDFLQGVVLLDQEFPGINASDLVGYVQSIGVNLSFQGTDQPMSTYDLFVFWHMVAASRLLQVGNSAHGGPIFLPWHRMYLIALERELQRVLGDPEFGMPYWDWAADGSLRPWFDQWRTPLWTAQYLGEPRGMVSSGALADMRVRLYQIPGTLSVVSDQPRRLWRQAGVLSETSLDGESLALPTKIDEATTLAEEEYDRFPWSSNVTGGHRNRLEGFIANTPMHNRVHVWVGGDMLPMSSPNDPVFFLNHCNVDRIWQTWMDLEAANYRPGANQGPAGHRINSMMFSIFSNGMTPADVLNPAQWYSYDSLAIV